MMKRIDTGGIGYLERLAGSDWLWGSDYTSGDLYEAEELWRQGHRIRKNRLVLVHQPDGRAVEPVKAKDGQYFGRPACVGGEIVLLLADFPAGEARLLMFDEETGTASPLAAVPLADITDCYNLMPHGAPLMLTRQTGGEFEVVWPERSRFAIAPQESFSHREGERLYFSRWVEDPDYRETVVVRRYPTGEVVEEYDGAIFETPDGGRWLLV